VRDVKRAYGLGAHGYLCKPTDFQKFKEMVGDMLRFWERCEKPVPNSPPTSAEVLSGGRTG
jgi:hypothetical protein